MIVLAVLAGVLGFAVAFLAIPPIIKISSRLGEANRGRDLHHTHKGFVPRYGGLALAIALVVLELFLWIVWKSGTSAPLMDRGVVVLSCLAMFTLGFWDDIRPLGAKRKLLGQCLISFLVWYAGIGVEHFRMPFSGTDLVLGRWGCLFTIVWLVGMTNLINLIDGVDGLAGGICLMLLALTAYVSQATADIALLAAGMAGALLGFLRYNFPPAKIYLGDGGAYFLGFQIGLFSLVNSQKGTILAALAAPLFVLALPIVDTGLAITRRGIRGLPIFRADRHHIHHHLLGMGMSRRRVVLSIYAVTAVFMVFGLVAFWSHGKLVPVLLGAGVLLLLLLAGNLSFSREWFAVGRVLGNSLEMRQEIQYALALTRWLALEGRRSTSIDSIWSDFSFAARKLGFVGAALTLCNGRRCWSDPVRTNCRTVTHEVYCGGTGVLELTLPGSQESSKDGQPALEGLSEILAELLCEGLVLALRNRQSCVQNASFGFDEAAKDDENLTRAENPDRAAGEAQSVAYLKSTGT